MTSVKKHVIKYITQNDVEIIVYHGDNLTTVLTGVDVYAYMLFTGCEFPTPE